MESDEGTAAASSADRTESIRLLAAGQHGVVGREQLLEADISSGLIQARLANGRLLRVFPGVYAVGTGQLGREGRWKAATLAAGPRSALSHRSAASLHGLLEPGSHAIEVVRPGPRRAELFSFERPGIERFTVRVHCTRVLPRRDIVEVNGIPVTSIARTLLDSAHLVTERRLRSMLLEADRLRSVDRSELAEVIERGRGWSGIRKLRRTLGEITPDETHTRSDLEVDLLRLCRNHGIARPAVDVPIGPFVVDFYWPTARLIVETDTYRFHGAPPSFRSDRKRDVALTLAGYRVVRFTEEDVLDDSIETARKLKGLLRTDARGHQGSVA